MWWIWTREVIFILSEAFSIVNSLRRIDQEWRWISDSLSRSRWCLIVVLKILKLCKQVRIQLFDIFNSQATDIHESFNFTWLHWHIALIAVVLRINGYCWLLQCSSILSYVRNSWWKVLPTFWINSSCSSWECPWWASSLQLSLLWLWSPILWLETESIFF